jgi:hypothetical protein
LVTTVGGGGGGDGEVGRGERRGERVRQEEGIDDISRWWRRRRRRGKGEEKE